MGVLTSNISKVVIKSAASMEFNLIYRKAIPSGNNPDKQKKHQVREIFHPQLKRLWQQFPLIHYKDYLKDIPYKEEFNTYPNPTIDDYSDEFSVIRTVGEFKFAPLICKGLGLYCEIEIKMLNAGSSKVINHGDLDNKLKTLFDGLRYPNQLQEIPSNFSQEDEKPFYCLLENDDLIKKVSVSVDQLLYPEEESDNVDLTLLHIKVKGETSHLRNKGLIT